MMGGKESIDFLAPSGSGENTLVTCENGDYAADLEIALGVPRAPEFPERLDAPGGDRDAGRHDDRGARGAALGIDVAATSKAMPVVKDDGTLVLALVRGDDRLEEAKLLAALGSDFAARDRRGDPWRRFGAEPGSLGPVGFDGEIVADETLREGQFVAGANRTGWHLRGVERGRDYQPRVRRPPRSRRRATAAPNCGGALGFQTAIEVGHIFKLGTRYSEPLGADVPRRGRQREAARDGLLRHRPGPGDGRGRRAAPRRERASSGRRRSRRTTCTWSCCPGEEHVAIGEQAAEAPLGRRAATSCSTTATCAPGEKFADADLIGCPSASPSGKKTLEDGTVDVRDRDDRRGVAGSRVWSRKTGTRADGPKAQVQRRAVRADDRAADGRDRTDLPRPRRQDRPLGRLPQPPRPRQPPGAVERRRRAARRARSASSRSTSASTACASSPTGSRRCPSSSTGSTADSRSGPRRCAGRS